MILATLTPLTIQAVHRRDQHTKYSWARPTKAILRYPPDIDYPVINILKLTKFIPVTLKVCQGQSYTIQSKKGHAHQIWLG